MDNLNDVLGSLTRVIVSFVMAKAIWDCYIRPHPTVLDIGLALCGLCYLTAVFLDSADWRWFNQTYAALTKPSVTGFLVLAYFGFRAIERHVLAHGRGWKS
ncbi:hypothetical protein [Meiothermus granaticius]|uniref:Uncharacterized protein n=1 Tax=Meiothermus granaticius NBRC 107808 TaxID=1227551 RepID=A0A399FCJ9_9DEIN|nr:hypothetical protein [Meiothermus granaticius]RIH93978.1 hypothetical protein Mgrana_00064 [Meiothermus granaticius NBRC 107808]GEM88194.1 hypothetical protein MGR01S_28190 [Meiothermus granaticius NBRC 107808]